MAKSFNVNQNGNLNDSDNTLKSESNKHLKYLTTLSEKTEALNDCGIDSAISPSGNYPRSKVKKIIEEFRALRKNNSCDPNPYNPCVLDDTGLVVPDATPEVNIKPDKIVPVGNDEITITCKEAYADYLNQANTKYYGFLNDSVTIGKGTFITTLRNPTSSRQESTQLEMNILAKELALSQLVCGYENNPYELECPSEAQSEEDKTLIDLEPLTIGSRESIIPPGDITVNFNSDDLEVTTQGNIRIANDNFKSYDESLKSQLFARAVSGLSCTYGNERYEVSCGSLPDSINKDNLVQNVLGDPQIMPIGSFVKNLSTFYGDFFVEQNWNLKLYGDTSEIETKLKNLAYDLLTSVNEQAEIALQSASTCNYGNTALSISCPTGYESMIDDDINSTIDENIFVISENTSDMISSDPVSSGEHSYILNFDLYDSSARTIFDNIYEQIDQRKSAYTSYNCGIYNNTVTVYCDRATAEAALDNAGDAIIFRTTDTVTDETTFFRFYITNHANSLLVAKAVNTDVPTKDLKLVMSVSDYLSDTGLANRQTYYPDGVYLWEHDYPNEQKVGNDPTVTVNNDPWQCYPMGVVNYPTGGTGTNAYALSACSHNADSPISSKYTFTTTTEGHCEINSLVSEGYPFTNVTDPEALYQPIEVRLADEGMGITSFSILAKSFIELYQNNVDDGTPYSPQELQAMVNERAVEQARSGVSCLYGNILIHEEDCSIKIGSCTPFENNIPPPQIPANTYFADTPTNADRQAVTAHNAMAFCLCADWIGGGGSSLSINLDGSCSNNCTEQYCVFSV